MVRKIFHMLLRRPVTVAMFFGGLLIGGIYSVTRLPIELAPTIEFPALSVTVHWPHASAETVEMFITAPIEEIANTVHGVRNVRSVSREGYSQVSVEFDRTTEMNFARLNLHERLSAFAETLPEGAAAPYIEPFVPEEFRNLQGFLTFSLVGRGSSSDIRKYALEVLAPRIASVRGVARTEVLGGEEPEIQIDVADEKLAALGLRLAHVTDALGTKEVNAPAGALSSTECRYVISVRMDSPDLVSIKHLPVGKTENGSIIRLGDVAVVRLAYAEPQSLCRVNGKPSVTLVIDKEQNINTLALADAVAARLDELVPQLPAGFQIIKESDKSMVMRSELAVLYRDIVFSVLCIWVVLMMFFGNVRAPLVLISSVLFSVAGTLLVFLFTGIGLHMLTLAGMVLGFGRLTDDSIVVLDNIQRHSVSTSQLPALTFAVEEIALPVLASTLTTVGALLPIAFLPEDLRPYLIEFGLAAGISLIVSLIVSFTLIPSLAHRLDILSCHMRVVFLMESIMHRSYRRLLRHVLRRKRWCIAAAVWLFGFPLWLLPERVESQAPWAVVYNSTIGSEWYGSLRPYIHSVLGGASYLFFTKVVKREVWDSGKETYIIVSIALPQGTDIQRYDEIVSSIEQRARTGEREIKRTVAQVTTDGGVVWIEFEESETAGRAAADVKNRMTVLASQVGGATVAVAGFGPAFYSAGEGSPAFNIRILGYNYAKVKDIAGQLQEMLGRNRRIADIDIDGSLGRRALSYEVAVNVDRDAISRNGLTVVEVIRAIRTCARGALYQDHGILNGEQVSYTVKFEGYRNFSLRDLQSALIVNAEGRTVRLSELISFETRRIPSHIRRENQQYVRWVSCEYKGPAARGQAAIDACIQALQLPDGYKVEPWTQARAFAGDGRQPMTWLALAALVIVFMVTASLYESFVTPFIVILSVPCSLIGLFFAFYATGTPFGRGGYASVILLIGIAVTNSIVLVDYAAKQVALRGRTAEVLISASTDRVRPVLMTSMATVGGLTPMLFTSDQTSMWYSLALGTVGGLLSCTLLTLVVVPVVFASLHRVTA